MFRNSFAQILILTAICSGLVGVTVFGQAPSSTEINVSKCWSYPSSESGGLALVSDGTRAYVGGDTGRVQALSLDGQKVWATELGGDISSNILANDTGLYLATETVSNKDAKAPESLLRLLSKETGITIWTAKLPDANKHYLNDHLDTLVVVSNNGVIQSLDSKTGILKWKREIAEGFVAEPRFLAEKLIVASTAKQVFVVSLATGEIDSLRKLPFSVTAVAQSTTGDLIVGDERGNLTSFLGGTEKVNWKFRSGGEISAIINLNDHILVTSHDNFVYSIATRNGSVVWKWRLSGRVSHVATYEDKYALISGFDDHGAVLTDLVTGRVSGQITLGDEESLTSNPIVANGLVLVLTSNSVNAYSLNGCTSKKEGGPGK